MNVEEKIEAMERKLASEAENRRKGVQVPVGLFAALQTERLEMLNLWLKDEKKKGSDVLLLAVIEMLVKQVFEDRKRLRAVNVANNHFTSHIKGLHLLGEVMSRIATDEFPPEIYSPEDVVRHFKELERGISG